MPFGNMDFARLDYSALDDPELCDNLGSSSVPHIQFGDFSHSAHYRQSSSYTMKK